jgi:diguanylate cyclase (GGDEF)-like protein
MIKKMFSEYRLLAVVGLLLIPIGLLGWLFVNQSFKDVRFASKERMGAAYLSTIFPIYSKLIVSESPTTAQLDLYRKTRANYDRTMEIGAAASRFEDRIASNVINYSLAVEGARDLIATIGDKSNLILDPDLDSYYMMDVAMLRMPEIIALSNDITTVVASRANIIDPGRSIQQRNLLVSQIKVKVEELSVSLNKSFSGNADGSARRAMRQKFETFFGAEQAFLKGIGEISNAPADAYVLHRNFSAETLAFMKSALQQLDVMLAKRVDVLTGKFATSIGVSLFMTLLALILAFTVLRRLLTRMDDKIIYLAHHDSMTRLKNRGAFTSEMIDVLQASLHTKEKIALHLIDLDNFKSVNDTLGHQAGDAVLKGLAERLVRNTRPTDTVGRLGGDEFVVLQRGVQNESAARAFADRLVFAMREPVTFQDNEIRSSISIGTAVSPLHASTPDNLMAYADMALYAAKAAGRDQTSMFTAALEADVQQRRRIEDEVKRAVEENRFTLAYQPQFDSAGVVIQGFEALLRLRSSTGQNISPAVFIPVAEQLGLIQEIGTWVLDRACEVASHWPDTISLAVNLSPLQFTTRGMSEIIARALKNSDLKPSRLQVEITEGILMENTEPVLAELAAIRALGVSIVMDDFGTGYSSLGYLWRFPFDKIKIDRSFISALEKDEAGARNILRTIVSLGHSLAMKVTAEGVETNAQANFMSDLKCDEIQGFLYGKPAPEEELPNIILTSFQKAKGLSPVNVKGSTVRKTAS